MTTYSMDSDEPVRADPGSRSLPSPPSSLFCSTSVKLTYIITVIALLFIIYHLPSEVDESGGGGDELSGDVISDLSGILSGEEYLTSPSPAGEKLPSENFDIPAGETAGHGTVGNQSTAATGAGVNCKAPDMKGILTRVFEYCGEIHRYKNNWVELLDMWKGGNHHLVYDADRNYVWVTVPKIASSNLKRYIIGNEIRNTTRRYSVAMEKPHIYFRDYRTITPKIAASNPSLQRAFTFTLIRHPWRRLYSAYKDKILSYPQFDHYRYIRVILERVRGWSETEVERTAQVVREITEHPISFPEFLRYISTTDTDELNDHWAPWFLLTFPCHIKYDLIGYHEDFSAIYRQLKETLFEDYRGEIAGRYKGSAGREELVEAYRGVSEEVLEKVHRIYRDEFELGDFEKRVECI